MVKVLDVGDFEEYSMLRSMGLQTDPTSFWASEPEESLTRETRFIKTVSHPSSFVLGYFNIDLLVSIGAFCREPQLKLSHKGFIWGIYTHPDHRGRGFGKQLVQDIIDKAFGMPKLNQINISTGSNNHTAIRLYENLGSKKYGEEINASSIDGNFYNEVYLAKSKT